MVALKQASTVLSFPLRFPPASTCSALRSWVSKPCPPYPSLAHVFLVQIALHVAQSYPGAQFYIGCAQIKITSGGSASPPKVALPGAYKGSDPGITVNIYNNLQSYSAYVSSLHLWLSDPSNYGI